MVAAGVEWVLFYFLLQTHLQYLLAFLMAFAVSTTFHYYLTIRFVFTESRFMRRQEITMVFVVAAIGLAINTISLMVFVQFFLFEKMFSKVLATGTAFSWNYLARKHLVFASSGSRRPSPADME
ncbi:MAG: GtrA family protein [Bacteroidetes bacterium]|nr:GtrA family protein [Bacteroidota bacterium]